MSLHGDYDPNNIFAKILRGDMPAVKVYEDEHVLSFMDVFPQAEGHTLVIPKNVMARNFLDLPTDKIAPLMERVQKVAKAVEKGLSPDGIILTQFNGAPAGQTVYHLHFHIIPRKEGEGIGRHASGEIADLDALQVLADKIKAAF